MRIPKQILALHKVASTDSSRPALQAINFNRDSGGKPWATATDGFALVTATWVETDAPDERKQIRTTVPTPAIVAIARATKEDVMLDSTARTLRAENSIHHYEYDKSFPDALQLIEPDRENVAQFSIDACLWIKTLQALVAVVGVNRKKQCHVVMEIAADNGAPINCYADSSNVDVQACAVIAKFAAPLNTQAKTKITIRKQGK